MLLSSEVTSMTRKRLLQIGLLSALLFGTSFGCAALEAWKSDVSYNKETGEAKVATKGAGKGGTFTENKGLNLSLGDNTATIVIVGLLVLGLVGGYAAYNSVPHKALKEKSDS
jgi:hypothetical protein